MNEVERDHQVAVTLGKIETKLEHITDQLTIIHGRIEDREKEIENVEALARSNADRLTTIEAGAASNRTWVVVGLSAVTVIALLLDLFWRN